MQYPLDHIAILRSQATWITRIAHRIATGEYPAPPNALLYELAATRDAAQKALNEIYQHRHHGESTIEHWSRVANG